MKLKINIKIVLIAILFLFLFAVKAQTVYFQGFNTTLAGSGWANTNLTTPWGNGTYFGISNQWQNNDNESGMPTNVCGAATQGDPSLYIGATGFGSGAAYLANVFTNRRISSPNINTTGFSGMTLSFDYIGNGSGTTDKGYLQYSVNGGVSWLNATGAPTTANPAMGAGGDLNNLKSQICSGGQGRWTNITWALPATCDNITNLRIAFVWQNSNVSASPTDPSFAVDDVLISVPVPLPIESSELTATSLQEEIKIDWSTFSEKNNLGFDIERSINGTDFTKIGFIAGKLNCTQLTNYSFLDKELKMNTTYYYRFKQKDLGRNYSYSNIVFGKLKTTDLLKVFPNPANTELIFIFNSNVNSNTTIQLQDLSGKIVFEDLIQPQLNNELRFNVKNISEGIYIYKVSEEQKNTFGKIIITH